jgi:predicted RNA-binding protein YlxR (DUF448 family)
MRPKAELLRLVAVEDKSLVYDGTGKRNGRGTYICRSLACMEAAVKMKRIPKALGQDISAELRRETEGPAGP